jgi:hypothetical protein
MRISEWATKFGYEVVEPEASLNAAAWPTGNKFVVKDLFTTLDGLWDQGKVGQPGCIPQWAIDDYAIPNELGGATHCFVRVEGLDGKPVLATQFAYWTDGGYARLAQYDGKTQPPWLILQGADKINPKTGWFNFDMNHTGWPFNPDTGAHGPCCVIKTPGLSAVVTGIGLPKSAHISTFVVFKEVPRDTVPPVVPPADSDALTRIAVAFEKFNAFLGVPK